MKLYPDIPSVIAMPDLPGRNNPAQSLRIAPFKIDGASLVFVSLRNRRRRVKQCLKIASSPGLFAMARGMGIFSIIPKSDRIYQSR